MRQTAKRLRESQDVKALLSDAKDVSWVKDLLPTKEKDLFPLFFLTSRPYLSYKVPAFEFPSLVKQMREPSQSPTAACECDVL
ncbi:hypothetical protein JTE90_008259 [Oedothorax gibbosus]|uniref:Uncharacterized protein n=1 Tax=Oedothorax gibbosus TaxID=931172 RepID=A0AAV6TQI7_9ARAC|nr:hypothetical protein JTE90_008259 [Oedothorax gibbosus]